MRHSGNSSRQLVEHNLVGTINLLEFCRQLHAGFILLSTSRVYSIEPLARLKMRIENHAFVPVAEQAWLAGNYAACIQAARRAVAIAPGDERATRRLVSALDHTGDRGAAVAAYEALAHRLHADYEVFPSAETQALIAVVRARALAGEPIDVFHRVDVQPARSAAGNTAERKSEAGELHGARGLERYGRNVMRTAAVAAVLLLNGSRSRTAESLSFIAL